jgi:hypothetical protein
MSVSAVTSIHLAALSLLLAHAAKLPSANCALPDVIGRRGRQQHRFQPAQATRSAAAEPA